MDDAREQAFMGMDLPPERVFRRALCAGKVPSPQQVRSSGVPIPRSAYCASPLDSAIMRMIRTVSRSD